MRTAADDTALRRWLRRLAAPVMRPVVARATAGEERLAARLDAGAVATDAALAALSARLAAIEARPAPPPQASVDTLWTHAHEHAASIQAIAAQLEAVRAELAALAAALDPLVDATRRDRSDLRALLNRSAAFEDALGALQAAAGAKNGG